jgi:guanylate kinase
MELTESLKQKVAGYKPTPAALDAIRTAPLMFMVGITSAGKNALLNSLQAKYPNDYYFLVSHTTRAPRENLGVMERDGVEYYFIDNATMEHKLDNFEMIEAAVIHNGWVSGVSIDEIKKAQDQGRIAVSDVEVQGVASYVGYGLNLKPVFVLPPSFDIWKERLIKRYGDRVDDYKNELVSRMESAIREIEHALNVDYFYIVINDDLDKTVELVNSIAHGEPIEPHYHKAMEIADQLLNELRTELAKSR